MIIAILCCLFAIIIIPTGISGEIVTTKRNMDCNGNDILVGENYGPGLPYGIQWSMYECQQNCVRNPECTHFTFAPHVGCYLKKSISLDEVENSQRYMPGYTCGIINERLSSVLGSKKAAMYGPALLSPYRKAEKENNPISMEIFPDCDYEGYDLPDGHRMTASNDNECGKSCIEVKSCTHFSWSPNWGCYLKHTDSWDVAKDTFRKMIGYACGKIQERL